MQEYTCEKCNMLIPIVTYRDMNLVFWVNHNEPDHVMCLPCWNSLSEEEKTKIYDKAFHKPQIYTKGKMTWWYPLKEQLVHRIMEYLNEKQYYGGKVYDCGEFGLLHILWFRKAWDWQWLKVEPLPDSLCREKEEE